MSEFKTIPNLPKYEMDKEGNIQTVDKKTPILPYPIGSRTVKLYLSDKSRQEFNIDELVAEVFAIKIKVKNNNPEPVVIISEISDEPIPVVDPDMIKKVMDTDTFTSVKMWKLHEMGLDIKDIEKIIGPPNSVNVATTIEKYKKNETLRKRADKVSVA